MRWWPTLLPLLSSLARAEETSEAEDFNVTAALLDGRIDISAIPSLQNIADHPTRSLPSVACSAACKAFNQIYSDGSLLQTDAVEYIAFNNGFWSKQQADARPTCIFRPENADAVAVQVLISRLTTCPFAVKSGGHAAFLGASNIPDGITVDFSRMNEIKLSQDKKVASIQPGNTWSQVYAELAKNDVIVIGGRVERIGVGGLTLGGGISFLSPRHGLAVDNVASYEVISATGTLLTASPTTNPDLYWALRGGGNNFGIVVRFHYETVPLPNNSIWGGTITVPSPAFPSLIKAYHNMVLSAPTDPDAGGWLAFALYNNTPVAGQELYHASPSADNATIFSPFSDIQPLISSTTQTRNVVDYTVSLQSVQPYGLRELFSVITIRLDLDLLVFAQKTFFAKVPAATKAEGSLPVLVFQTITIPMLKRMQRNGGNPLGLTVEDGPYVLVQFSVWWGREEDDDLIYSTARDVLDTIKEKAVLTSIMRIVHASSAIRFGTTLDTVGHLVVSLLD
ncbi:hypothetical protein KVT40_001942 [Elsinoe batatas]|uniref:FAD-binding PCMH-type domain-containing protein n=1 Tax=Elsinoe batatas TaxID=2601811 RepID=A0A8K0LDQ0_9PEZI|nr:hypothetical protein KVT40_001942 [Elsinoe batatas]